MKRPFLAAEMFNQALALLPTCIEARKNLRAAQVLAFKKSDPSALSLKIKKIKTLFKRMKIKKLIDTGNGLEAMRQTEELMAINPFDQDYIDLAVKAAECAKLPEAAALTIEAAYYSSSTNDRSLLEKLATYYTIAKNWSKAKSVYKKILESSPSDQRILQLLKNTEAQLTIASGWEQNAGKVGGTRELLRDKEEAERLDRGNKAEITGSDVDKAAEEYIECLKVIPHDANAARALARIYIKAKRYNDAISVLENITKIISSDPELDKMLSNAKLSAFDMLIEERKKRREDYTEVQAERDLFELEDLTSRVERYPNDGGLRFEVGSLMLKHKRYDDAIRHLQIAQKSIKNRLESLYLLAKCFIAKGQRDLGVMQLETAFEAIPTMTELKKKIIYELAACAEDAGEDEKAYNYYKDIYSNDVTFLDVESRMMIVKKAIDSKKTSN